MNIDALCDWGERTQPTKLRLQGRRVGNEVAGKGSHGSSVLFGPLAFRSPTSYLLLFLPQLQIQLGKGQDLTPYFCLVKRDEVEKAIKFFKELVKVTDGVGL